MKLQKLIIKNIASIEDAIIDFEQGPLADDSCFLICGPTGSGKSTILDAICLALYNETPRMHSIKNEKYNERTENFGDEVSIADPRGMMRRGSDIAFVELYFTDNNDRPLKAVWQVQRAKNRGGYVKGGKIQSEKHYLCQADDTIICSKKTETAAAIRECLGLTFEQFCRTCLLAQGEFTKFLKSSEDEKSAILEKLTGTEIYTEISREIHRIKSEKEKELALKEEETKGVRLLSEEEELQIKKDTSVLDVRIGELNAIQNEYRRKLHTLNEYEKSRKEQEQAANDYTDHQKEAMSEAYLADLKLLADWDLSAEARTLWKERQRLTEETDAYPATEKQLKDAYVRLKGGLLYFNNLLLQKTKEKEAYDNYLTSEKQHETLYSQLPAIEQLVKQIKRNQESINSEKKEKQTKENELNIQTSLLKEKEERLQRLQQTVIEKKELLEKARQEAESYDLGKLTTAHTETTKRIAQLEKLKALLEKEQSIAEKLKNMQAFLQLRAEELKKCQQEEETLKRQAEQKEEERSKEQNVYELTKKNFDDFNLLTEMRNRHQEGDKCPLCGNIIHRLPTETEFTSLLRPLEERIKELKKEEENLHQAITVNRLKQKNTQTIIKEKTEEKACAEKDLKNVQSELKNHPLSDASYDSGSIAQAITDGEQAGAQLEAQIKKAQSLNYRMQTCQKNKETAEKETKNAEIQKQQTDQNINDLQKTIKEIEGRIQSTLMSTASLTGQLLTFIDADTWEKEGENGIVRLRKEMEKYVRMQKECAELGNTLHSMNEQLERMENICTDIEKIHDEWRPISVQAMNIPEPEIQWNRLNKAVVAHHSAKQSAETQLKKLQIELEDYFNSSKSMDENRLSILSRQSAEQINGIRKQKEFITEKETRLKANLERAQLQKTELEEQLKKAGYNPQETTPAEYQEKVAEQLQVILKEQEECHERKGKNNAALENNRKNKELLEKKIKETEQTRKEYERWYKLHQLFGSNDGKKFRNIAQSYVLRHLLTEANHYLYRLSNRYELECQPGLLTILIRDKEAGGVTRPTTTISGGEGFLISLSLALGLSSLSKKALSVDTLFIDEGFGTLDSTYLSTVMDTLERLHQMGGKKIGIISHVESLKERLTTQIQVIKENNTTSRVCVKNTL